MTGREIKRATDDEGRVPVASIEVPADRLRPVSEAGVEAVMSSIGELGLMKDPIHLRLVRSQAADIPERLVLIAGGHRLAAASRLGWETVPARVWECSDDWARLMEVDDNLAGAELSPLDTAVFLAERKYIYEALHPGSKWGGDRRSDQVDIMSATSFAKVTAEKFGVSERHVRRLVSIGGALEEVEVRQLRGAPRTVTLADLQQLSKLEDPADRIAVVRRLHDGSEPSAARAIRAHRGVDARPISPEQDAFERLMVMWERAPRGAKARFRRWLEAEGYER
jgi:ParB family chromosome partitioning protein